MFLARNIVPFDAQTFFVGLGAFLCWVSIMKYIEHAQEYSYFSRTIAHAGPDVIRNLVNVIPFFLGFAFLGMSVFWQGYRFRNPSIAFFSLFCIMLGDEISNTFNETMQIDYLFGAIYMFCFVFFSMQVMMNIFLIIIGDSYSIAKDTHKYDWVDVSLSIQIQINYRLKLKKKEKTKSRRERAVTLILDHKILRNSRRNKEVNKLFCLINPNNIE